jgi:hypothetical protein
MLSTDQMRLVESAAHNIPADRVEAFQKFVEDCVRAKSGRHNDSDVFHAVRDALQRYAEAPTQH